MAWNKRTLPSCCFVGAAIILSARVMADPVEHIELNNSIFERFPWLNMLTYSNPDAHTLRLPNLKPKTCRFGLFPPDLDFSVKLKNEGASGTADFPNPGAFDVIATLQVNPNPNNWPAQMFQRNVTDIAANQQRVDYLGTASLPNITQNIIVTATVVVDPPTPSQPGGVIWETNEMDNTLECQCIIYSKGSFPAKGDPPVCD